MGNMKYVQHRASVWVVTAKVNAIRPMACLTDNGEWINLIVMMGRHRTSPIDNAG